MSDQGLDNQIPPLRNTQFESSDLGSLKSSVNLFRGDVNYPKVLVALPGKPDDDTLAVQLAMYSYSNVSQEILRWSLDAPTGVLGLGWRLPTERITVSSDGALAMAARSFTYDDGQSPNALVPSNVPWVRAELAAALAGGLEPGPVPAALVTAFAAAGLRLAASATVAGSGPWTVDDGEGEHLFMLTADPDALVVTDGGALFDLQDYEFWKISYYAKYERWEITDESGAVKVFGGGLGQTGLGYGTSAGNSVEWGVKWGNATDNCVGWGAKGGNCTGNWAGASQVTTGQGQYAVAWHLAAKVDRYGDRITYGYNGGPVFARNQAGLLQDVEQLVGSLPYTKACYLTSITDAFRRTVHLEYAPKTYTADAQEYMDPHKVLLPAAVPGQTPSNLSAPNAYQDRYETMFLRAVRVHAAEGPLLYRLDFRYSEARDVTHASPAQPGLCRRYLLGVTESNGEGQSLPGYLFDYNWHESDGPNRGALRSITFPSGGVGELTYGKTRIACNRRHEIAPPKAVAGNARPRVWFGDDYAVVVWTNSDQTEATLDVYTWVGHWQRWTLPEQALLYQGDAEGDAVVDASLIANDVSFALTLTTASQTLLYLFNADPRVSGAWRQGPQVTYPSTDLAVTAGDAFVLVTSSTSGGGQTSYTIDRYLYDWRQETAADDGWVTTSGLVGPVSTPLFALASGEYYLYLAYDEGGESTLYLNHLDPVVGFTAGDDDTLAVSLDLGNNSGGMAWAAGPAFAAWSVADTASGNGTYTVQIVQWGTDYQFLDPQPQPFSSLPQPPEIAAMSWPPAPVVIDASTVAAGGAVFRYSGGVEEGQPGSGNQGWSTASLGVEGGAYLWLAYAYGTDVALVTGNDGADTPVTNLVAYDANGAGYGDPVPLTTTQSGVLVGYPSVGGEDWLIANNGVYYRGAATGWAGIADQDPVATVAVDVDTRSLIDEAPAYFSYLVPGQSAQVQLQVLRNGAVPPPPPPLDGYTYFTTGDSEDPDPDGQYPAGPRTFAVYPSSDGSFAQAQRFVIYRYAGNAIEGELIDYPVQSLQVADGFGQTFATAYDFDPATAGSDPTGTVIKYYKAAVYDGCATPDAATSGRAVTLYHNGFQPGAGASMLDGQEVQTVQLAGAALWSAPWSDALALPAEGAPPAAVSSALAAQFSGAGVTLSAQATIVAATVDGQYAYWLVTDPVAGTFNLDLSGGTVRGFSGQVVASTTKQWTLFAQRSIPTLAEPVPLHGGFARTHEVIKTQDGVALTTRFGYRSYGLAAPLTGGCTRRRWSFVDGDGERVDCQQDTTYAARVYPALLAGNVLTPSAASLITVARAGTRTTTAAAATTFAPFVAHDGVSVVDVQRDYGWAGDPSGDGDEGFDFTAAPDPAQWVCRSQITARSRGGVVLESIDAAGLVHSTRLDTTGQLAILIASGASAAGDEVAYCGFEADEELAAWTLAGGAAIAAGDAHTGVRSVQLGAGTASRTLAPADPTRVYICSCWYKLPEDASTTGAGLTLVVAQGGNPIGTPIAVPFTDATGRWTFAIARVDLPAYGEGPLSVTVTASAGAAGAAGLDDVSFAPLAAAVTARVHDPVSRLPTAQLAPSGKTWRTLYDAFWRDLGQVAPGGAQGVKVDYYSRQGNPTGFAAGDPNASTQVKALVAGSAQSFCDGVEWQAQWTPDDDAAFTAVTGTLVHASAAQSNTLTCAWTELTADYALHLQLAPPAPGQPLTLGDTFSITADTATIRRDPTDGQWMLVLGGTPIVSFGPVVGIPSSLLLVVTGAGLLFYADGRLLFSAAATLAGAPAIVTGANALGLRNLAVFAGPSLHATLSDATGVARQQHVLGGTDYLVKQIVRDACGREVIRTKAVPGQFGGGVSLAPMLYRPTLVDVAALLADLDGSGVMTGDVASYYDGTTGSDDGGYPYARVLYEASPLGRVVELGQPGAAQAIVLTTPPAERATAKRSYGNNAAGGLPPPLSDLPVGWFRVVTELDQAGTPKVTLLDATGKQAGRYATTGGGPAVSTTATAYGPAGAVTTTKLPNAFQYGDGAQQLEVVYNSLGQLLSETHPDGGTTRYLYDGGGRVRVLQDAAQAVSGELTYVQYDLLGRETARGIARWDWTATNTPELSGLIEDPSWPDDGNVPYRRMRVHAYDGDGNDPQALGQEVSARSFDPVAGAVVAERWQWNRAGLVASHETTTAYGDGTTDGPYQVSFGYDNVGELTQVGYPLGDVTGLSSVSYQRDRLGRLTTISDQTAALLGSFTYDPQGAIATAVLGDNVVQETLTRDSLGRVIQQTDTASQGSFTSALGYTPVGTVLGQTDRISSGDPLAIGYGYDPSGQILSATVTADPSQSWSCGYVDGRGTTDQNGNLQTAQLGTGTADRYVYARGGNRLEQIQWSAGGTTAFAYQGDGAVRSRTSTGGGPADLALTYLSGSSLTSSVTVGGTTEVQLVYDSRGQRVGKRVLAGGQVQSRCASVRGPLRPLVQIDSSGTTTAYVFGPRGLLLVACGGDRYPVVVDHVGSSRVVFDASGAVAASYQYLPFGQVTQQVEPRPGFLVLLFTGQELDLETGLYNFNARLYDGALGRFYGADPMTQFPSPYLYAANNPLSLTDPTGMIVTRGDRIGLGIGLAVLLVAGGVFGAAFAPAALAASATLSEVFVNMVTAMVVGGVASATTSAAFTGIKYDATHSSSTWSWSQFGKLEGIAADTGAAGGVVGGIIGSALGAVSAAAANAAEASAADAEVAADDAGFLAQASSRAQKAWQTARIKMPSAFLGRLTGSLGNTALKTQLTNMFLDQKGTAVGWLEAFGESIAITVGQTALNSTLGAGYRWYQTPGNLRSAFTAATTAATHAWSSVVELAGEVDKLASGVLDATAAFVRLGVNSIGLDTNT